MAYVTPVAREDFISGDGVGNGLTCFSFASRFVETDSRLLKLRDVNRRVVIIIAFIVFRILPGDS